MNYIRKLALPFSLLVFLVVNAAATPAKAITAELANKCRALAIKAHPRQRAGTKAGNAGDERKYYRDCVSNGGSTSDKQKQNSLAAPTR